MLRPFVVLAGIGICFLSLACGKETVDRSAATVDDLIPDMLVRLNDPEPRGRIVAANFFGGQGEKAREAIPLLRNLTKDNHPQVRDAAIAALARLEGTSKPVYQPVVNK